MSSVSEGEIDFEIGHVLLIDTVGYSELLINEQKELLDVLNRVVRNTRQFHIAEAAGKLIRLPTGDGMALVFSDSPESPVECALEISKSLKDHPNLPIRMGIHSGPVSRVMDVNDRCNIAGAGINMAQRVMECADAGHILLSKRTADDLAPYRHWQPYLHALGECVVKHGGRLSVVNLYTEEAGNPELPAKVIEARKQVEGKAMGFIPRGFKGAAFVSLAVVAALSVVLFFYFSNPPGHKVSARKPISQVETGSAPIAEKSIAVLPFANLSDQKGNAYFVDGMQDEILTDLAKVADIKVISRTSVMQYRSEKVRNLREIAHELRVTYVLEGSVQCKGTRIRVSAQLVDARSDTHIWAQRYDRELADVFAIQSEVAEEIVLQLEAKLSPREKAAIEEPPTTDLVAYAAYARAKTLLSTTGFNVREKEKLYDAVRLLEEATVRDPNFYLAYCELARMHDRLYLLGIDHTAARLASADEALKAALHLRPNGGEAHLALASHVYSAFRDYARATEELGKAEQTLPNEALVFELKGYIARRAGRWNDALDNLQKALSLDPRNVFTLQQISLAYLYLRRYQDMADALDRALALAPDDPATLLQRADVELEWRADTRPLHQAIQTVLAKDPGMAEGIAQTCLYVALVERDNDAALRALAVMTSDGCRDEGVPLPRAWCEGIAARVRGDTATAMAAFGAARSQIMDVLNSQPNYPEGLCVLGMTDAALGKATLAQEEGRRAVELLPIERDAINGALLVQYLAAIYAWSNESSLALDQLEIAVRKPGLVSYGQLKLHPLWDPLRGNPRFEKIMASLAPKK